MYSDQADAGLSNPSPERVCFPPDIVGLQFVSFSSARRS